MIADNPHGSRYYWYLNDYFAFTSISALTYYLFYPWLPWYSSKVTRQFLFTQHHTSMRQLPQCICGVIDRSSIWYNSRMCCCPYAINEYRISALYVVSKKHPNWWIVIMIPYTGITAFMHASKKYIVWTWSSEVSCCTSKACSLLNIEIGIASEKNSEYIDGKGPRELNLHKNAIQYICNKKNLGNHFMMSCRKNYQEMSQNGT